jgi:hypothetical protein
MGLFSRIASVVLGRNKASAEPVSPQARQPESGVSVIIAYSEPSAPAVEVSHEDVTKSFADYCFVPQGELLRLKAPDRRLDKAARKRRARQESDYAWAWLLPFIPAGVAKLE